MNKRTLIVTLELEADLTIKQLADKANWQQAVAEFSPDSDITVRQVRAQVAQGVK